jgi:hypothetical protein
MVLVAARALPGEGEGCGSKMGVARQGHFRSIFEVLAPRPAPRLPTTYF